MHPADFEIVQRFNEGLIKSKSKSALNFMLSTQHTPLPYFGSLNSKLVILMANPGLDPARTVEEESPEFREMFDLARKHELTSDPFVFLAEKLKETPGGQWWRKRLGKIIDAVGIEVVKQSIFTAEIHAYKSVNYKPLKTNFPTQSYTFETVQRLVDKGAYVILGRAKNEWKSAISGLSGERLVELNSNQNSHLTEGNMPLNRYNEIIQSIKN